MSAGALLECPVCRSPFRSSAQCPRCGADLSRLMELIGTGWRLRRQAREALAAGACERALHLAAAALETHATPAARDLVRLAHACSAGARSS